MSDYKIDKANKKKLIWKTVAAVSIIMSFGFFAMVLIAMCKKSD